jgi:hypothetical protein
MALLHYGGAGPSGPPRDAGWVICLAWNRSRWCICLPGEPHGEPASCPICVQRNSTSGRTFACGCRKRLCFVESVLARGAESVSVSVQMTWASSVNACATRRWTRASTPSSHPASRSDDTPPAADSSTSTAKQPEHSDNVSLDAPAPPPHDPTSTSKMPIERPNAFPAPTRPAQGCEDIR